MDLCDPCEVGMFQPTTGQRSCVACARGSSQVTLALALALALRLTLTLTSTPTPTLTLTLTLPGVPRHGGVCSVRAGHLVRGRGVAVHRLPAGQLRDGRRARAPLTLTLTLTPALTLPLAPCPCP